MCDGMVSLQALRFIAQTPCYMYDKGNREDSDTHRLCTADMCIHQVDVKDYIYTTEDYGKHITKS